MDNEKRRAGLIGFTCSFIYLACFFLSFYLFVFAPSLLGNPEMTTAIGLTLVFLSFLTPLSIIVAIALIWNRYLKEDYKGVYKACLIPPFSFLTVIILFKLISFSI